MRNYLYLMLLLAIVSCKKEEEARPVLFYSRLPTDASVAIYRSQADYFREASPIAVVAIKPDGTGTADGKLFEKGRSYYYDFRDMNTPYGNVSNWGRPDALISGHNPNNTFDKFIYTGKEKDTVHLYTGHARDIYLGMDNLSCTWKTVNAYYYHDGTNVWNSLTAAERDLEIIFKKDYTITIQRKNNRGEAYTMLMQLDRYGFPNLTDAQGQLYEILEYNKDRDEPGMLKRGKLYVRQFSGEAHSYYLEMEPVK